MIQLGIDNSENKILILSPQLPKELTGGDGYKYRFKPNVVPWICFSHKESKRPGYLVRSMLRNSSSGLCVFILTDGIQRFLSQPFVSSFSSCSLLKDSKAPELKWREKEVGL